MFILLLLAFFSFNSFVFAEDLKPASQAVQKSHKEARISQKKINQWDDETKQLTQQYRSTLKKTDNLRIYNEQLAGYIESQKKEILNIRKKIEEVKDTGKEIVPLMLRMLSSLEQFIELDVPFLPDERKSRIQELKEIMNRSDVSLSEKYRQLISVYKVEQNYGRTLQSYRGIREIKGKELTVDYLRLGRLVFIYKSLDNKYMSYWDHEERTWKKLPKNYRKHITKAIKISLKQIPPDLIKLPLSLKKNSSSSRLDRN